jgi:hypothetical protein
MAKPKIALGLADLTPAEKVSFATGVHGAIASHATTFPTPVPALTALNTAISNLDSRLAAISVMESNLDAEKTLARGDETTLDDALTQLASYVETTAKGDASTILLSGFNLANPPVPIGPLPPPENLQGSTADIEGNVNLKWNRVRGARSYFVECATNPAGPWAQVDVTTPVSTVATGLVSGTKYWFRVRALGAAGFSGWSDPAQKMAA